MCKLYFSLTILIFSFQIGFCQQNIPNKNKSAEPLYMLTYDHGGLVLWGADHFQERLHNAESWLDKYPDFKIGLDNEAHMYDELAVENPKLLEEIKLDLTRYQGRFGIGTCTYGQPLSQFINEESNIRQIGYAIKAIQKYFNYTPKVYVMSEHAMHSQIPQIIKGFGFEAAIMRTHFMMYGYNPTYNSAFGWWVGPDGSRIPTVPTYDGEGAEFFKTTVDNWILTRYPGQDAKESLQDFKNQFSHIHPLLASRVDDSGLRKEELVKEYEGNPDYKWILLDEIPEIYPKPDTVFVTKPDDFKVRMPWGYCGNIIWNKSRSAETRVLAAERLDAFRYLVQRESCEKQLNMSWKNLLVAQHHDIQIVGLLNNAEEFLAASLASSGKVIDSTMAFFEANMAADGNRQVTVFNPVSWKRTEWIETVVSFAKGEAKSVEVVQGGQKFPVAFLQKDNYSDGSIFEARIVFAADMDPLSINSYSVLPVTEETNDFRSGIITDAKKLMIQTPYYRVKLNAGGGISSLINTKTGVPVFDEQKRSAYFTGLINGEEKESKGRWIIEKVDSLSPWVTATEYGFIDDIPYTFQMKFYTNKPRVDCNVQFDFNGQKIGQLSDDKRDHISAFVHEKKLRFKCYPATGENVSGIRDLPFIIASTQDKYVEGNYWTAIKGKDQGLAYFNRGNMGSIREADDGFSIPLSYAMYYIWGTRMLEGKYTYKFAIYPFGSDTKPEAIHRKALEYNYLVIKADSKTGNGKLGSKISLLDVNAQNINLSALYVENNKLFMRLYESAGTKTHVPIQLKWNGKLLFESNLKETKGQKVVGETDFNPWEFKTFLIE